MCLQKVQMDIYRESFFENIDSLILSEKGEFLCVGQDVDAPPYPYTFGLTETYGCPELLIFGVGQQTANAVFHALVDKIEAGARFLDGDVLLEVLTVPCSIKAVSAEVALPFALNVASHYEDTEQVPTFQQIVYPDRADLFPWDLGYDKGMKRIQTELWAALVH